MSTLNDLFVAIPGYVTDGHQYIGKAISQRPEKGAAVAAAEFLQAKFPDRTGFSPRNVRRMRDFYRTYENDQTLLRLAMKIGWTLNVVIMEAELTSEARKWYLKQARERQWSKKELLDILSSGFEPDTEALLPTATPFSAVTDDLLPIATAAPPSALTVAPLPKATL